MIEDTLLLADRKNSYGEKKLSIGAAYTTAPKFGSVKWAPNLDPWN